MASSCTCTIQRPWSSTQITKTCTRTWASPSTTTSSPPRITPISWRISSKGPAARRLMSGNGFHPAYSSLEFSRYSCNVLIKSLQSADIYPTFGLWLSLCPNGRRLRAAGCFTVSLYSLRFNLFLGWYMFYCLWVCHICYMLIICPGFCQFLIHWDKFITIWMFVLTTHWLF